MNEKETHKRSKFLSLVLRHQPQTIGIELDVATSTAVGQRRGKPVLLKIHAGEMQRAGHEFFVTPHDVWLTEQVPAEFIEFPDKPSN